MFFRRGSIGWYSIAVVHGRSFTEVGCRKITPLIGLAFLSCILSAAWQYLLAPSFVLYFQYLSISAPTGHGKWNFYHSVALGVPCPSGLALRPDMIRSPSKVLFLTGAPLPSSLNWSETDLSAPLQTSFADDNDTNLSGKLTSDDIVPSWRSLSLEQSHLPTGLTQASRHDAPFTLGDNPANEATFPTATDPSYTSCETDPEQNQCSPSLVSEDGEILSQYYEHSFAVHEDMPSSQLLDAGSTVELSFSAHSEAISMNSPTYSEIGSQEQVVRSKVAASYLSDLRDIPNAAYLRSIIPQTMSVNLVVGIISISQPRTIITRRGGRSVDLVEMLVGDSTRSGFGINIWLPCFQRNNQPVQGEQTLASQVLGLRPQDVVLARTIALSSFNGRVYGSSLRRNMTSLDLLYRNVADADDGRGTYRAQDLEVESIADPQVFKVKKVKDWVMQFVGNDARPPVSNSGLLPRMKKEHLQILPSDTP